MFRSIASQAVGAPRNSCRHGCLRALWSASPRCLFTVTSSSDRTPTAPLSHQVRLFSKRSSGDRRHIAVELCKVFLELTVQGYKIFKKYKEQKMLDAGRAQQLPDSASKSSSATVASISSQRGGGASGFDKDMLWFLVPGCGMILCGCWAAYEGTQAARRDAEEAARIQEEIQEEFQESLKRLQELEQQMTQEGGWKMLAGTEVPSYWTSDQAMSMPSKEFECVEISDPAILHALQASLRGYDIGAGGRDAVLSGRYRLQLAGAWRIENRTLWGKFASERLQVQHTMKVLREDSGSQGRKAASVLANVRAGLHLATAPLRALAGFDARINEAYLFHGLGNPAVAVNVCASGMNEHFSGVNAGTMFGDGIYFAEDMGKSDQYCACADSEATVKLNTILCKRRGWMRRSSALDCDVCYVFLARVVLGCIAQVGQKRNVRLHTNENIFAAGTRELAFIPGAQTPTHFHSEVAEIDPAYAAGRDTHTETSGNKLRFREFILFRPTLIYPEYLIAYRRT
eukprot:TRINITY_DN61677_c0_g1_i1.p1 TRINITY_DN61677_c0_g1~~TRINITY_DN61677_c0_g1_i1.p1  ORF type:complete len:514 (+),score=84.69 TRINITY_DN61677_c0_g1_i1:154-1695(+)